MTDEAHKSITIHGSVDQCRAVIEDYAAYPTWAKDVKQATVLSTDDGGRGLEVSFQTSAFGRSTTYTLLYEYPDDGEIRWSLLEGDIMRRLDGRYVLDAAPGDDTTEVTYHLSIDLAVPLPGFLKRRAEERIVTTALNELRARVERD